MPGLDPAVEESGKLIRLPFPSVTKRHILNCSYEFWFPKYRTSAIKSRIISLTPSFLDYLREDGLWLPDDTPYEETEWSAQNCNKPEDPEWESNTKPSDASRFADVHQNIQNALDELGGSAVPKLNWSSPKDALHMALSKNSMECKSANDIYLLLKSSIFITHDLEHAFDDCVDIPHTSLTADDIPYVLVLRPFFKINTAFEFRCFVRDRTLIGISQRDLKYVGYSEELMNDLQRQIQDFFDTTFKGKFPDPSFTFDVYLPEPHNRIRLIDINPWAPRTDPLLFSWLELLTLKIPGPFLGLSESKDTPIIPPTSSDEDTEDDMVEDIPFKAELRIVQKDDPEAYNFGHAPYSAHKLPREVVDASIQGGSAMNDLMEQWERLMKGEDIEEDNSEDDLDAKEGKHSQEGT